MVICSSNTHRNNNNNNSGNSMDSGNNNSNSDSIDDNDCAIVFGGWNGHTRFNDLYRLDLETWEWTEIKPKTCDTNRLQDGDDSSGIPCPRSDHTSVLWSSSSSGSSSNDSSCSHSCMVLFGGSGDRGVPLADVWFLHMPDSYSDGNNSSNSSHSDDTSSGSSSGSAWWWERIECAGDTPLPRTSHAAAISGISKCK